MRNPPKDLRNHLASAGIGLTTGTNIFTGSMRAAKGSVPVDAAFVTGIDGVPPVRSMQETEEILTVVISVILRWGTFAGGDTKMRDIRDNIQSATISGYLDVVAQSSEPISLGEDADGNHQFMLAAEMTYIQVASA